VNLDVVDAGSSIRHFAFANLEQKKSWKAAIESLLAGLTLAYQPAEKQFIYKYATLISASSHF